MRGTADQIALAQWLFIELDVRAGGQSPSARSQSSGTHEYRVPSTSDDVTRVFFLSQTDTARGIQAIAVAIRTVAEIQRLFICTAPRALALRGTASQIGLAEWLIKKLDKPADGQPPARQNQDAPTEEYRMPGSSEIVRVIYTAHTDTAQDSQQIVTAIRVIGEIQRILLCPEQKALALRGTADQIALAGWLFNELDKPATEQPIAQESPGVHDYRVPANGDEVRGVHVSDARTAQSVQ